MERLYEIMGTLSEIEFTMESLSSVLEYLDEIYELKHDYETQKALWIIKILNESMLENLSERISEMDRVLLDSKKKSNL